MANSKAEFYYRSYIDQDLNGYSVTGDFTTLTNINDRRQDTYAISDVTGTGDGTSEEIIADMLTERQIDTIFLKSNFKTFTVWMWSDNETGTGGEGWEEVVTYSANASAFLKISFDQISTKKIKVACTHTITANEEKKCYLLEITKSLGELTIEKIKINQSYKRKKHENIYGGTIQVIQYPNRAKVEVDLDWSNMMPTDYAVYATLKTHMLTDAFLVYLYLSDSYDLLDSTALYLMNDLADKSATPEIETLSAGVAAEMKLREC